jgi:hypothetical protein
MHAINHRDEILPEIQKTRLYDARSSGLPGAGPPGTPATFPFQGDRGKVWNRRRHPTINRAGPDDKMVSDDADDRRVVLSSDRDP